MGSLYGIGYSGISGPSGVSGLAGSAGVIIRSTNDFRLTLSSGVPIPITNQDAQTTLYLTPFTGRGGQISLYYNSTWQSYQPDEISISLSGKTANKNNDVFTYYNGSAVALELVEWTNDTTRATSLNTQDGVFVKSGDATKRYVGTIRTTGTTGQCEDSFTSRYVWNMYNRASRWSFTANTTANWSYATVAWREYNAGTGQLRFKFVLGMPQCIIVKPHGNTTGTGYVGYAIDTTTGYASAWYMSGSVMYYAAKLLNNNVNLLPIGYHYVTGIEQGGTITNYGGGSTTSAGYGTNILFSC